MRQDFFRYVPQFKLVIAGNHKPGLRAVDEAIRRRLHLVPFTVTIPAEERDLELSERLREEWSGILQWAIEGCLAWKRDGLCRPAVVLEATEEYLAAEDVIGRWIEERCVTGKAFTVRTAVLFADYKRWCEGIGEDPGSMKTFSEAVAGRGFRKVRMGSRQLHGFAGLALRTELPQDGDQTD
jgi:putative DNA primase/helicase